MIGAIVGDIVGSRYEYDNIKTKDFDLFDVDCFVTDDSVMTLAIAKAIMETYKALGMTSLKAELDTTFYNTLRQMTIKYMQKIGRMYPDCGFAGMFERWVFSMNPRPYNSFGNGSAMRVSPIAYIAKTEEEVIELARTVTAVTHNHLEGLIGAEATALCIFMAKKGHSKQEIREKINQLYYDLNFTIDEIRDIYSYDVTCPGTVPPAIVAFFDSESFEDAIRTAISVGGDSDTLTAITGSIAEAFYGVPESIKNTAIKYMDSYLKKIYYDFDEFLKVNANF